MPYYAQLNQDNIVTSITETEGQIYSPDVLLIQELDNSLLGKRYDNGVFVDVPVIPSVPSEVTMKQARLALLAVGLLDDIDTLIKASPREAQIEWEYASTVSRSHPLISAVQAAKGLTDADIDALFIAASEL